MKYIIQNTPWKRSVEHHKSIIPDLLVCEAVKGELPMVTFIRSMEMAEGEDYVHLEDDTTLAPDFMQEVEKWVAKTEGMFLIQFFSRRKDDLRYGTRFRAGKSLSYNCCIYVPKFMSAPLTEYTRIWMKKHPEHTAGYDLAIADYLDELGMKYLNVVPSLVQHNVSASIVDNKRPDDRSSKTFWWRIPEEEIEHYKMLVYKSEG